MLNLFDTFSRENKELIPGQDREIKIYVCGPTVDGPPHLGHGRLVICFDVLRRYLEFLDLHVRFVSNITDIDDKIIAKANSLGVGTEEIANKYEAEWFKQMDRLNCKRPTITPRATEYIEEMLAAISKMIESSNAYIAKDGIYFSVASVQNYGELSKQNLESLREGVRIDVSETKINPADFALWKFSKENEPSWPTPWGPGRPGWHTECVVMASSILGPSFDLHGGAEDLIFPHHENELAQASALGMKFARIWSHVGWVMVEGEKMSKSKNNFRLLSDVFDIFDPRALRLLVLQANYRSQMEISKDNLEDAQSALKRIDSFSRSLGDVSIVDDADKSSEFILQLNNDVNEFMQAFRERMEDNLDTAGAISQVFSQISQCNAETDPVIKRAKGRATLAVLETLGIEPENHKFSIPDEIANLLMLRDVARKTKNYSEADKLRKQIEERGFLVEDLADKSRVYKK